MGYDRTNDADMSELRLLGVDIVTPKIMKKTYTVDWDSLDEVSRLFNRSKTRFFELKRIASGTPSRKARQRSLFDACLEIWNTDLSDLYAGLVLDTAPLYYVYVHTDTSQRIAVGRAGITTFAATLGMTHWPFYVGKGTGGRWQEFNRNETHRKVRERMLRLAFAPQAVKVVDGVSEVAALQYEAKLIDILGLITSGGYLSNLDEGLAPDKRRARYPEAYGTLRRINKVTHVNDAGSLGKTRVVPDTSTKSF